jgi:DNA polymerase-3 subunit epsilon
MPAAAFDLETSGTDVFSDRVVTGCIVRVDGAQVTTRNWLADPEVEIPTEATEVHGISTEYAREHGRPHAQVVAEIVNELYACWNEGRQVAIFNAAFDISLLATHFPAFEVRGLIVDPYVIDRELDPFRKGKRTLGAVCEHYGVRLDGAHSADGDALAAARLAWKLPRVYPILELADAASLMESQANWHRERQFGFIDYLRRNNRPYDDVSVTWPMRSSRRAQAA